MPLLSESRRAARRAVNVDCELMIAPHVAPIPSRCTELSPYGMWLETETNAHAGDEVVLCFVPPRREREVLVFGRVKRTTDAGLAVEFESLDDREQRTLAECLRGIPPRFPGERVLA